MMLPAAAAILAIISQVAAGTVATSNAPGKAFDRIAIIYFENQDYDKSYGDCMYTRIALVPCKEY
jgi:acid phosphatase